MGRTTAEPHTLAEYIEWHRSVLERGVEADLRYYEIVVREMRRRFEQSDFWTELCARTHTWAQGYYDRTTYALWASDEPPKLLAKSKDSFVLKVFRKNVLENQRFPEPPEGGWYVSANWFARTNDIVRSCLVVRYLDGVEEVCECALGLAQDLGYELTTSFEAREEGYYAAHMSLLSFEFRVPSRNWDYTGLTAPVELQVTTQVKDVIRDLTHRFYEVRRMRPRIATRKWQWDYEGDDFAANYLGHTLHYLEGTIMDVRERAKRMGD